MLRGYHVFTYSPLHGFAILPVMTLSAKKMLVVLGAANVVLIGVHVATQFFTSSDTTPFVQHLLSRLNMDNEVSIPTWFSQTLLLGAAVLFAYMARIASTLRAGFIKTWWFLAGLFLFASIDEGSSLHELATEPMQEMLGITGGPFFFAWVIPGIILCVLLCLGLLRFFLHLPRFAQIIFAGGALALFGAIGIEMISGMFWQASGVYESITYPLLNVLEEGLENTASILTIYGLLRLIASHDTETLPTVRVTT